MRIHPNERTLGRLIQRVGRGRGRRVLRHLLDCGDCRDRLGELLTWEGRNGRGGIPWSPRAYGAMLDRLVETSAEVGAPLSRQQVEAPILLAELLLQPGERRRLLLRNSARFRSWPLAELLFDRSREEAFEDPAQAESLARLGLEVVAQFPTGEHDARLQADLQARGLAYLSNALRMRSDLLEADEIMSQAQQHLDLGSRDPLEEARILELKASLRKDQLRFNEAIPLLNRAISKYRSVGESHREGRALLTLAEIHRMSGMPSLGIEALETSTSLLDRSREPRLLLCVRHNLAFCLSDEERYLEAHSVFESAQPLYDQYPDLWTQHRRAWVEGRIQRGLGQLEAAEERLTWAQRGFVEQEIAYDAALVSLDLAAVYAEQGRTGDLKELAAHMLPIFQSRDIHREALAALAWFRQAVERETATASVVRHLLDFLKRARHDPGLRWVQPG